MVEWFAFAVASAALALTGRREWLERQKVRAADLAVVWTQHPKGVDPRDVFVLHNRGSAIARDIKIEFRAGDDVAFINGRGRRQIPELRPGHSLPLMTRPGAWGAPRTDGVRLCWTDDGGARDVTVPIAPGPPTWPQR